MSAKGSQRLDLWFAVAAGPGPWMDGERLDAVEQLVVAGAMGSALALGLAVTTTASASLQFRSGLDAALFGATFGAAVLVLFSAGFRPARLGALPIICARAGAALAVLALTVKAYGSVQPTLLAGFGLAAGAQATVTLRLVGVEVRWGRALGRFLASAVHAGVLTGGIVLAFLPSTRSLRGQALDLAWTLYALIATTTVTAATLSRLLSGVHDEREVHIAGIRSSIHRDQAHWLHDDVCSELGYLRLRLQDGPIDTDTLRHCLDDLDHRLRIRQIDEILDGGPARLGEIMQPYIRVAQSNGVELIDVPTYETGAMLLPPAAGRQVQRAIAVLTANAVQAGARQIAIRTELEPGGLIIEVEDDAGGFDVTRLTPGRGLDGLAHDLGPERLELVRTRRGTMARAHVAMVGDVVSA
jgi:hypothetical protein